MVIYRRNKGDRTWRNCCVATRTLPTSKECWFRDVTPCSKAEIRTSSGNISFLQLPTHWRWWEQAPRKVVKDSGKPNDGAFQKTVVTTDVTWLKTRNGAGHRPWVLGALTFEGVKLENKGRLDGTIPWYTGCNRRNGPDFGRVFLMSNYTDITQNTYIQSSIIKEILAREVWNFDSYYSLTDYQIHIETGRNMWFL